MWFIFSDLMQPDENNQSNYSDVWQLMLQGNDMASVRQYRELIRHAQAINETGMRKIGPWVSGKPMALNQIKNLRPEILTQENHGRGFDPAKITLSRERRSAHRRRTSAIT